MTTAYEEQEIGAFFRIKHGYAFKGEFFSDTGDKVLLTPGNFSKEGGLKLKGEKEKYYSGPIPADFVLAKGDLIIAMTDLTQEAPILGAPALIPEGGNFLHNQRLGKIVNLNPGMNKIFLYYTFNLPRVREQIKATATGATVKHTAPERIYAVKAPFPPLPTQRRIASVLSAYDDLIENNTRRIKVLEEMARALYREWFVEVDRSSWQKVKLGDICDYLNRGISPKYDDESGSIIINQKCVRHHRVSLEEARRHKSQVTKDKILRQYDVLINSTGVGTLGRVAQILVPLSDCTVDSHVTIARPSTKVDPHWFGMTLLGLERYFEEQGVGATGQTELTRSRVFDAEVCLAPTPVQNKFGLLVAPLRAMTVTLLEQSVNLRRTRDLLLPRLMSGEVDVSRVPLPAEAVEAEPEAVEAEAVVEGQGGAGAVKRGRGRPRKKG